MMNNLNKTGCFLIAGFILLSGSVTQKAKAQRARFPRANEYQRLAFIQNHPPIYLNEFLLPGDQKGQELLTTTFKINYKRLSFKKMDQSKNGNSFYSPVSLTLDVFHSNKKDMPPPPLLPPLHRKFRPGSKNFKRHRIDVKGLSSIAHAAWNDTAYAANFTQTRSINNALSGSMQVKVQPGYYIYLIKPAESDKSHKNPGITRRIHVTSYGKRKKNNVIFVKSVQRGANTTKLNLINMGHRVIFGKNFYAFIHLPNFKNGTSYTLTVEQVQGKIKKNPKIKRVYKQAVSSNEIVTNVKPVLQSSSQEISLILKKIPKSYSYALIKIPNHNFSNAVYKLTLTNTNTSQPVAVTYYQSYWKDMPASLLNLNVAIKMLRYIASKQAIQNINNGSFQQRRQKFTTFWKAKDPSPKTPFNELEAEYYARIDSTYKKFTTQNTLGFNSSRGKVYILYGPQNINNVLILQMVQQP